MNSSSSASDDLVEEQAAARAQGFERDGWIILGFAVAITVLRTYSRWSMAGFKRFQADDFLVWLALGLYVGQTVIDNKLIGEFRGLANDFDNDSERSLLSPLSEEYALRVGASKLRLAGWLMYAALLWSLKAAMAVFYLRLTDSLAGYRSRIYVFFAVMVTTFCVSLAMPFLTCMPITKMWQIDPDPGPLCYPESSPAVLWTLLGCNIVTDAFLLWIPMPMLFQASLPKATRIVLVSLFGCGLFVTIAATLRISLVAIEVHDFHAIGFWSVSETFVAIATTNLPAIFVLVRRWLRPWMPSLLQTANSGTRSVSVSVAKAGHRFSARSRGRGRGQGKVSALYGSDGAFVGYVSSGRRSQHVAGDHGKRPPPAAPPSFPLLSAASGRKSASSQEGSLDRHVPAGPGREHATLPRRSDSLGRGGGSGVPLTGIRKQVDIVVVEEALDELGVRRDPARLHKFDFEFGKDVEKDAGSKPLPSLPAPVHQSQEK